MAKDRLTPKQKRFVEKYLEYFNGREAALYAGYSEKSASMIASENLTKPKVVEQIQLHIEEQSARTQLSADNVLLGLNEVFLRCMQHRPVLDKSGNPTGEFSFKPGEAIKALELIGKHLGMFSEKLQIESRSLSQGSERLSPSIKEKIDEELGRG